MQNVAFKIEAATENPARYAHSLSCLDLSRHGYGLPSNLTLVGDAVDDAIDSVLPYRGWKSEFQKIAAEIASDYFQVLPLPFSLPWARISGRAEAFSGGVSIQQPLIYGSEPLSRSFPFDGVQIIADPRMPRDAVMLVGMDLAEGPSYSVITNVKIDASAPDSSSPPR